MKKKKTQPIQTKISLKSHETLNIYMSTATLDPSLEVLIGIHGGYCDHRCLKPLFPYLEKEFQVIVPDFRGQGKSELLNPITCIEDLAEELALVMDHFQIKTASFFTWSLGSSVAISVAALYPSRVRNLFFIAPMPIEGIPCFKKVHQPDGKVTRHLITDKSELVSDEYNFITWKNIINKDEKKAIELLKIDTFDKDYPKTDDLIELADQVLNSQDFIGIRWAFRSFNSTDEEMYDVPGNGYCKKVKAPVYIFLGERDYFWEAGSVGRLQKNLPTLKKIFTFDAPHGVQYYYPKEVSEYIITILKEPQLMRPNL